MRLLINDKLRVMWKPRPSAHSSVTQYQPIFMSTLPIAVARLNFVKIGAVSFMYIPGVKEFLDFRIV